MLLITATSWWAWWRLKSPAIRLFTQLFVQAQKKTSKLRVTGLCVPAQRTSTTENVFIWLRHHVKLTRGLRRHGAHWTSQSPTGMSVLTSTGVTGSEPQSGGNSGRSFGSGRTTGAKRSYTISAMRFESGTKSAHTQQCEPQCLLLIYIDGLVFCQPDRYTNCWPICEENPAVTGGFS